MINDAIEKLENFITLVKKQSNYKKIWQISYRSSDSENEKLVGDK